MKKNGKLSLLIFSILLIGIGFFIFTGAGKLKSSSLKTFDGLGIAISSSKETYLLGETVFLNFEVKNDSSEEIRVRGLELDSNYVSLYIAFDGEKFKKYTHSRIRERNWWVLKPGQIVTSKSGILWNFNPAKNSANLKELEETDILTDLAFPKPGVYLIKAVLGVPDNENPVRIESKPIQILINEPAGDELAVWKKIKNNDEIAYFIQENDFRTSKPAEKEKLLKDLERITTDYPDSLLAGQIKQSLGKFRETEEKIKESLQKSKNNQ